MSVIIKCDNKINLTDDDIVNAVIRSGDLKTYIRKAIIDKILADECFNSSEIDEEQLLISWRNSVGLRDEQEFIRFLADEAYSIDTLKKIVSHDKKLILYEERRWGQRIRSLYLKRKNKYEQITYKSLAAKDLNIMQEIYFRVKDGEQTWDEIAMSFPEGHNQVLVGPVPISHIEAPLIEAMKEKGINKVTRPVYTSKGYAVAEMITITNETMTEELRRKILRDELNEFLDQETSKCITALSFNQ